MWELMCWKYYHTKEVNRLLAEVRLIFVELGVRPHVIKDEITLYKKELQTKPLINLQSLYVKYKREDSSNIKLEVFGYIDYTMVREYQVFSTDNLKQQLGFFKYCFKNMV